MAKTRTRKAAKNPQRRAPEDQVFKRTAEIRSEDVDEEKRSIDVAFSSETDSVSFLGIPQVLLHEEDAMDLEQLRNLGSVLLNHDPNQIIGRPENVRLDEKDRVARASIVFDDDPESDRVFKKVQSGSLRGVSVGFRVEKWQILDAGETWKSPGGRAIEGPADVATKWKVAEFSLTPIPADSTVGVGRSTGPERPKEIDMIPKDVRERLVARGLSEDATEEEAQAFLLRSLEDAKKPDVKADPPEAPAADPATEERALKAERERVKEIRDLCGIYPETRELTDTLIDDGSSVEQARKVVLDHLKETRKPVGTATRVDLGEEERDKFRVAAEDSLMLRTPWGRAALKDDRRVAAAREVRGRTLLDLAEECIRRAGGAKVVSRDIDGLIRRAISHSTSDFPNILSNVANKALLDAYQEAPATWRPLARVTSLADFKLTNRIRLGDAGNLLLTRELEPMPEGSFAENMESYQLATYSKRFGISRQALINDDLSAFDRIPRQMGAAAARVPQDLFWSLLVSAAGVGPTMAEDALPLFSAVGAPHASGVNYTAAAGAIAIATLGTAKAFMRTQTGLAGPGETAPALNITPQFLVVPAALEALALQFVAQITPAVSASVVPAWIPALTVIVEPRLDAATNGLTAWYLASTQVDGAEVGFLNGREEPTMVTQEGTNVLGIEWGVYLDCAAHFVDHRGWYRCRGA